MGFFNEIGKKTSEATSKITRETKLKLKINENKNKISKASLKIRFFIFFLQKKCNLFLDYTTYTGLNSICIENNFDILDHKISNYLPN